MEQMYGPRGLMIGFGCDGTNVWTKRVNDRNWCDGTNVWT